MTLTNGIDVSVHNGTIDWEKARHHVGFAMIRAGYGKNHIDKQFKRNADECTRLGIPFGVYWFSYALTEADAKAEAEYCLNAIKGYDLLYPVAFDYEEDSWRNANKQGKTPTAKLITAMAKAFLSAIEARGYYAINYTNIDYLNKYFSELLPKYDLWLAQWSNTKTKECGIWQSTSKAKVEGIEGGVDYNTAYKDYPVIISAMNNAKKSSSGSSNVTLETVKATLWQIYLATAKDVIAGKYGNGDTRVNSLRKSGYKPEVVQSIVNILLGGGK